MRVEIVCVGNELTREGRLFDSLPFLVALLQKEGVDVAGISTLRDEPLPLRSGLERLLREADLVLCIGGRHSAEIAAKLLEKKLLLVPEEEGAIARLWKAELHEKVRSLLPKRTQRLRERMSFVLTEEGEILPLMKVWGKEYPGIRMDLSFRAGLLTLVLEGDEMETIHALSGVIRALFFQRTLEASQASLEEAVQALCIKQKKFLSLAESCTGGAIAARLVSLPGASQYFVGGIVAYNNEMKEKLLLVPQEVLKTEGAVSSSCVASMVEGLFSTLPCDVALAVSGIAGPSGGTREKPIGTIWGAIGERDRSLQTFCLQLSGDRRAIIERCTNEMLARLLQSLM